MSKRRVDDPKEIKLREKIDKLSRQWALTHAQLRRVFHRFEKAGQRLDRSKAALIRYLEERNLIDESARANNQSAGSASPGRSGA